MRAKLKSFYCPDIENLSDYSPLELDNFCFLFRAMVGPAEREGKESFDIQICTPKWLLSNMKKDEIICGKYFLIVLEYNFDRIFYKIKNLIEACSGDNWEEIAEQVSCIGFWEFEDYKDAEKEEM